MSKILDPQEFAQRQGYIACRRLEDGSVVCLVELMFTTGLIMNCTELQWERRYCYDDPATAVEQYMALKTNADEPTGWIAKRPQD